MRAISPAPQRTASVFGVDGKEIPGGAGYKYFGVARELPGVKELLEKHCTVAEYVGSLCLAHLRALQRALRRSEVNLSCCAYVVSLPCPCVADALTQCVCVRACVRRASMRATMATATTRMASCCR